MNQTKQREGAKWQRKHMERFHLSRSHFSPRQSKKKKKERNNAMCTQVARTPLWASTQNRLWQQPRSCCALHHFSPMEMDGSVMCCLFSIVLTAYFSFLFLRASCGLCMQCIELQLQASRVEHELCLE